MHLRLTLLLLWFIIGSLHPKVMIGMSDSYSQKHLDIALRMVGHQILLQAGDSVSRVLPIRHLGGRQIIRFNAPFAFEPDQLAGTVHQVLTETNVATSYILEVVQVSSGEVVYGFEAGHQDEEDIVPCQQRSLPLDHYEVWLTLPPGPHQEIAEVASPPSLKEVSPNLRSLAALLLVLLVVGLMVVYRRRQNPRKSSLHLIQIGQQHFDRSKDVLLHKGATIKLSGKESELLYLLHQSANTTVEREEILRKVWGNDGDYIGRTLDVFVSKLRKKLETDPTVQIVNTRGVGYKLVIE